MYRILIITFVLIGALGCQKQDIDELRSRLDKFEAWQKSVNSSIASLQAVVKAVDAQDYVTGVTPLADGGGHTITFAKGGPIEIIQGKDGGRSVVGTKKDSDAKYYWTIDGEWLVIDGKRVLVDGDGLAPQMRVNSTSEGWEISIDGGTIWTTTGIKAQGDAIFAKDGVDNTDNEYVVITLADGSKINLPKYKALSIGDGTSNPIEAVIGGAPVEIPIHLPTGMKEADFSALSATIGDVSDIVDKATPSWEVAITKPTFAADGTYNNDSKVTISVMVSDGKPRLLTVSLVDDKGVTTTAARVVQPMDYSNFEFTHDGTKATLTKYRGAVEKIVIPSIYNGLPVTTIGDYAFESNTTIKTLIAASVTSIGRSAFFGCKSLASIDLPRATSIGKDAFYECTSLTYFNLPQATSISERAFLGCPSLTSVNLPQATSIGNAAFWGCPSVTYVNLPQATSIGSGAFYECTSLPSVNLPQATSIGSGAFCGCTSLASIDLPLATSIGSTAFWWCTSLASVNLPRATSIGSGAFYSTCLTSFTISSTVTQIDSKAFLSCYKLAQVIVLPSTPPTLGVDVFSYAPLTNGIKVPAGTLDAYKAAWGEYANKISEQQ